MIRITRVCGAAASAVAERDDSSMTAISPEPALAQRHDEGLVGAVDLDDLDLAVEHHEQLAAGRDLPQK